MIERISKSYDKFLDSKAGFVMGWIWLALIILALVVESVNTFG